MPKHRNGFFLRPKPSLSPVMLSAAQLSVLVVVVAVGSSSITAFAVVNSAFCQQQGNCNCSIEQHVFQPVTIGGPDIIISSPDVATPRPHPPEAASPHTPSHLAEAPSLPSTPAVTHLRMGNHPFYPSGERDTKSPNIPARRLPRHRSIPAAQREPDHFLQDPKLPKAMTRRYHANDHPEAWLGSLCRLVYPSAVVHHDLRLPPTGPRWAGGPASRHDNRIRNTTKRNQLLHGLARHHVRWHNSASHEYPAQWAVWDAPLGLVDDEKLDDVIVIEQ